MKELPEKNYTPDNVMSNEDWARAEWLKGDMEDILARMRRLDEVIRFKKQMEQNPHGPKPADKRTHPQKEALRHYERQYNILIKLYKEWQELSDEEKKSLMDEYNELIGRIEKLESGFVDSFGREASDTIN